MSYWRRFARQVAFWSVPPGFQKIGRSILAGRQQQRHPACIDMQRNSALHNRHVGQRCFVLATGPSINDLDLTFLQGELLISISSFYVHPLFSQIRPQYHCVAPLHPPFDETHALRWFREMETYMHGTTVLAALQEKSLVAEHGLFSESELFYLGFADGWFSTAADPLDLTKCLPHCWSATMIAIMVAIYLGVAQIILLGVDQAVPVTPWQVMAVKSGQPSHFYDIQAAKPSLPVEPSSSGMRRVDIALALYEQYLKIGMYAIEHDIEILNASSGGSFEIFPRQSYRSLFHSAA